MRSAAIELQTLTILYRISPHIMFGGRWKHEVKGIGGFVVPVYLLDCGLSAHTGWDRNTPSSPDFVIH